MAVANKMELGRELVRTLNQVNRLIDVVNTDLDELSQKDRIILAELLGAKAQCMHALAIINQRD